MTRIVVVCLFVALLAGAGVVAAGGVSFSAEQQAEIDREAARPYEVPPESDTLPPAPKLAAVAAPRQGPVGATVTMDELGFDDRRVTVRAGQSVRWVNRDGVAHELLADDAQGAGSTPSFTSGEIRPGRSFRATFATPGETRYVCTLHPTSMRATVVVR